MKTMTRQALYNPFGKCDELIKALVPHQVKDEIAARRRELGLNESEFLRLIIMLYLYGEEEVKSIEARRIEYLSSKSHKSLKSLKTNSFPSEESE